MTVALYRNGKLYARAAGRTTGGNMTFSRPASIGTYRTRVTRVAATGRTWDGGTPDNEFVKKPAKKPKPAKKRAPRQR